MISRKERFRYFREYHYEDHIAPALIIGAASALGSLAQGVYNSYQQSQANESNMQLQNKTYRLQREQLDWNRQMAERDFEYNKQLQDKIFQREDNAVQRMVADNRAAGLSPIAGLAGAGTGQALESNTPQLDQNFDTPQMSANQLNVDWSAVSNFGSQVEAHNLNSKNLDLRQQQLDLEKDSNEYNKRLAEQNIEASKIKNTIARATMQAEIENKNLAPQRTAEEIGRISVDTLGKSLDNELKQLDKIQSRREMEEWLENKGYRSELGKLSLDEMKAKAVALELLNNHNAQKYGKELEVLNEELTKLKNTNKQFADEQELYKALSAGTDNSAVGGLFIKGLMLLLNKL